MTQIQSNALQGGDLTIRLDDGMVLKSRVRGISIDTEVDYASVSSVWGHDDIATFRDCERYTLTAEFDGAYTIFNAPTAAHRVRVNVTDASIKGLMQVQEDLNVPDTAQMSVKQHPTNDDMAVVTFTWEA